MRTSRFSLSVAVVASLLTSAAVSPAIASEDDQGPTPVEIIEELVPEILQETVGEGVDVSGGGLSDVSVSVTESELVPQGTSFTVDYATSIAGTEDGLTTVSSDIAEVSAVIQATGYGVRVLTTIESSAAPEAYNYTFDVPQGTELVKSELAYYLAVGEEVLGNLQLPWAVDAAGASLPTTYSWDAGTLTQHVDLSDPAIVYPVVADPAWGYSYGYNLNKSATVNKGKLKSCFNCYFPVTGAPRSFPGAGQLLPLRVGPANFECKFKKEMSGTNYFGWQFDATKKHVDGLGSNIIFELKNIGGQNKLLVNAYIVNDYWWMKNSLYRDGAKQNWQTFAANLNR